MNIACYVMHHPSRPRPTSLLEALAPLAPQLMVDEESRGPWWNARRCWLAGMGDATATHALVVHDDAVAAPGAAESLVAAVAVRPEEIISFHSTRPEILGAATQKRRWLTYDVFCWGLALCMPLGVASDLVQWCDDHIVPDWRADDTRVLLYAQAHARSIWCTVPSLFQHPADGHGVLGNANESSPWLAKRAILDWSGKPLVVPGDRRSYLVSRSKKFVGGKPPVLHGG